MASDFICGFLCIRCEVMFIIIWSEFHMYVESWQLSSWYGGVTLVNLCIIEVTALISESGVVCC